MGISKVHFSRQKRSTSWLKRFFLLSAILFIVILGGASYWIATSLPTLSGVKTLPALQHDVRISRDAYGIPRIAAQNERDAFFALGFTHAQDRMLQMELMRRLGAGRLSELAGSRTLSIDKTMRTLGLYRRAQQDAADVSPEFATILDAYAAGVNAWLSHPETRFPPEFLLAGTSPEPWQRADSLVWGKLMGLLLGSNMRDEFTVAHLKTVLSPEEVNAFTKPARPGEFITLPTLGQERPQEGEDRQDAAQEGRQSSLFSPLSPAAVPESLAGSDVEQAVHKMMQAHLAFLGDGLSESLAALGAEVGGSNAWVVSGDYTKSGKPILANDPHLGFSAPILWYLARIDTPSLQLTGATVPGGPLMIIGHNGHIAWGYTTPYVDSQDLVLEKQAPDQDDHYLTPQGPEPFQSRQETIKVRFSDDETITIRHSRHGPIVSDHVERAQTLVSLLAKQKGAETEEARKAYTLAFASPQLQVKDSTAQALFQVNRAQNWQDFRNALRLWVGPSQNIFYGDQDGNIGMTTPGLLPIRNGYDGAAPVLGWQQTQLWQGYIPFEALPMAYNPPTGRLVNGNNRLVGPDYPYHLSNHWPHDYRAARIDKLLQDKKDQGLSDHQAIQLDIQSGMARHLLPLMLAKITPESGSPNLQKAHAMLSQWDASMARDRAEPLIFMAWLRHFTHHLYRDELGEEVHKAAFDWRPSFQATILTENASWCDDQNTEGVQESCAEQMQRSLEEALILLIAAHGDDMTRWHWGDAHQVAFKHVLLGHIPLIKGFFTLTLPTSGSDSTVNRAAVKRHRQDGDFGNVHGAGLRVVFDLADLEASRFIIATGQSGHILSKHFGDLTRLWRDGVLLPLAKEFQIHSTETPDYTLVLTPGTEE